MRSSGRVIACLQEFERDPTFRQGSFFFDIGGAILKDAMAAADSVVMSEEFDSWSVFGDRLNQQFVSELQSCPAKIVIRRKVFRDTNECWFGAQSAGSPEGLSAELAGVWISDIVKEGRAEDVPVTERVPSTSNSTSSTVVAGKKIPLTSRPVPRKCFEVESPVFSPRKQSFEKNPKFSHAFDREASKSCRWSGRDRRAAPVFQFRKK